MFSKASAKVTSRLSQTVSHLQTQTRNMSYNGTTFKLNTGARIPALGFGTWQDKDAQEGAVSEALKAGYRHIDTARVYGTEPGVGQAIKESGIPREEIFVTTKLWNNAHHPDDVEPALNASLKDLGLDYLDLYLMHWPSAFARSDKLFPKDKDGTNSKGDTDYVDTYKAMEKLLDTGKVRAIGVSNFSQKELERLIASSNVVPAAHQIELHPYLAQSSFDAFHKENGIHVTHYSPFGNANPIYDKGRDIPKIIDDPVINKIGEKYKKNGAQVCLAWGIAHGRSVIPKSKTAERIRANFAGDFELSPEDVKKIDALDKKLRFNDSSKSFKYNFFVGMDGKQ